MVTKKKEDKKLTKDQALKKLDILKKDLLNIRFKRINNQVENPALYGEIKKSIMIVDIETDSETAKNAGVHMILLEDGYTEKKVSEISHDHLIRDFVGIEKIISNYLND